MQILLILDNTDGDGGLGIGSLVTYSDPRQDPYLSMADAKEDNFDLESNSDLEDIKIKPTDNLVLVGHVEGNASILEVYGKIIIKSSLRPYLQQLAELTLPVMAFLIAI